VKPVEYFDRAHFGVGSECAGVHYKERFGEFLGGACAQLRAQRCDMLDDHEITDCDSAVNP
jgi:hypothetical protein